MRRVLAFGLLALAALAPAERRALLVGVDDYPWITEPARKLKGAATDVSLMGRTLGLYGFKSTTLLRKEATRERIVQAMEGLVAGAGKGDRFVFYFSGRGSANPDGEPVLVPADGAAKATPADIRMLRLEEWAGRLGDKGADVTIVLDASFVNPGRADYGRQYNPTPRCVPRGGTVRAELYKGTGMFLAACPSQGAAYEWLVNSAEARWAGAFTDAFTNALVAALNRGADPSVLDAMREVQGYFKDKVRAGYMPGLAPQPDMAAMMTGRRPTRLRPLAASTSSGSPLTASSPSPPPSGNGSPAKAGSASPLRLPPGSGTGSRRIFGSTSKGFRRRSTPPRVSRPT